MRISFLIPSKERLDLLHYAVASILAQSHADFEIVISDNASEQSYKAYIDELNDPRIVFHRFERPVSVTANWQKALSLSSGDYILMLGDDDALSPRFFQTVLPLISSDSPDMVYLPAFHYAYPGVFPRAPNGYLASVLNSEFLLNVSGAGCLKPEYARDLAASLLKFRSRIGINAQHYLISRRLIEKIETFGGLYQGPYPDTFAAIAVLAYAQMIVVAPRECVVIGISLKSFGYYYFSGEHDEGYRFLANEDVDGDVVKDLSAIVLPGDRNNSNWLYSAEIARRRLSLTNWALDLDRYRSLQILSVLKKRYKRGNGVRDEIAELKAKLPRTQWFRFVGWSFVIYFASLFRRNSRPIGLLQRMDQQLELFVPAKAKMLKIGPHENIMDAFRWLDSQPHSVQN